MKFSSLQRLFNKTNYRKKETLFAILIFFVFFYFTLRVIELSISIQFGIAPDEMEHIKISEIFSRNSFPIQDNAETYVHGVLSRTPYLYYLIMGLLLKINYYGLDEATILRLVNVIFSAGTLFFILKTSALITKSKLVQGLSIIVASNIAMFTFLSASISYDNLANLLATISIYYIVKLYKDFSPGDLMILIITLCLGVLTKLTLLPLALIIGLITLVIIYKERARLKSEFVNFYRKSKIKAFLLSALMLVSIVMVLNLYFVNIYKYKAIIPSCIQVTTIENCSRNPTFTRDEGLVQNKPNVEILDPYHYLDPWQELMLRRTVGIFGHQSLYKPERLLIAYEILLIVAFLSLARNINRNKKEILIILSIFIFYTLVLVYYQNYSSYKNIGLIHVALQGRYLFPVLSPLVILFSYFILKITKNNLLKVVLFIITSAVFILGDYLYFKRNVPDTWYMDTQRAEVIRETNEVFK